ncbi:penicillin acylase family protein, partial [Acinetobacter baumannii]
STAYRFTLYELKLSPLKPTQYFYDGELRDMTAVPLSIQVRQADGSLAERKRTLYRSHFGPMMTISAAGVPVLAWSPLLAYSMRD